MSRHKTISKLLNRATFAKTGRSTQKMTFFAYYWARKCVVTDCAETLPRFMVYRYSTTGRILKKKSHSIFQKGEQGAKTA